MVDTPVYRELARAGWLISRGANAEAAAIVDRAFKLLEITPIPDDTKTMLVATEELGLLAARCRDLGHTDREIRVLTWLCGVAAKRVNSLGDRASDDDIRLTAEDLILLGLAHMRTGERKEARKALTEANELLEMIGDRLDVDGVIEGRVKLQAYKVAPD